jgi:hypothetical protein
LLPLPWPLAARKRHLLLPLLLLPLPWWLLLPLPPALLLVPLLTLLQPLLVLHLLLLALHLPSLALPPLPRTPLAPPRTPLPRLPTLSRSDEPRASRRAVFTDMKKPPSGGFFAPACPRLGAVNCRLLQIQQQLLIPGASPPFPQREPALGRGRPASSNPLGSAQFGDQCRGNALTVFAHVGGSC